MKAELQAHEDQPLGFTDLGAAHLTRARVLSVLLALGALLALVCLLGCRFGAVNVSLARAWHQPLGPDRAILIGARLPRVLMGVMVGATLAVAGVALQSLVRNPLAESGTLGISGGAAFGAVLAIVLSSRLGAFDTLIPLCAFAMALLSTVTVYRLGQTHGRLEPFSLLLVGVVFNSFFAALILLVNNLASFYQTRSILSWLVGSLEAPTYGDVLIVAGFGLVGFGFLLANSRAMNLMALGDDAAQDLGLELDRVRRTIFFATSLMVGAAVSFTGMIAFVGLIVPHILRLMLGPDHRLLVPAAVLAGAAFLVAADLGARLAVAPAELPVGVLTALCGGPFFIYLLRREGRRGIAL